VIVFGAGLIGYVGGKFQLAAFIIAGGHGPAGNGDGESLLGDELPAHARPSARQSLVAAAVWLALWLTPVVLLLVMFGSGNVFSQIAVFFSKMAMVTFGGAYAVLA
jgi:chromate transporter